MAEWPEQPRLISTAIPRLDGLAKASGKAKYPSDQLPKDLLFGVMLYSPHAHAKVRSIDTTKAEKMPGVKGVVAIVKKDSVLRYNGDDVAAVAAETEEQARDAIRAIAVQYEILPHVATEAQAMADGAPEVARGGNVRKGGRRRGFPGRPGERRRSTSGEDLIVKTLLDSAVSIDVSYTIPVITHVCLETHGMTVKWEGDDKIFSWASTQAVQGTASELAQRFQLPVGNVTVLTEVMGGGFGSKFGAELWGVTAAELSKKAGGRPVRMFLDRIQEHLAGGNRPSASAHIRAGATKDGKLTVFAAETHGSGGISAAGNFQLPYVYNPPKRRRVHSDVFLNAGNARALRAPGHPQGCMLMEAAMDDLAEKLGIDPLEFRLKNLPKGDIRTPIYEDEIKIGAEAIGWSRRKPRGRSGKGPIKTGMGMALHQWGGGGTQDKQVQCLINPDGSVEVRSATQDLGTGARTVLAIIAAEILGLEVKDITSNIGNSTFPPGQPSGGSTTTPSMAPPTFNAVSQARDQLFEKLAKELKTEAGKLSLKEGKLLVDGQEKMSWKDACRKLGMMPISVTGGFVEGRAANGVAGCQFADVSVDIETGVVKVNKIVAVQDSGLIIDMMTWKSQVYGGVIGGLNPALFEERVMDPGTGLMLNPDMEMYKLAGASDIPEIVVIPYHTEAMKKRGVIGVGEPPTIATSAAIGNAVANALGVRVPNWPMTPMNVLNALAKEGKA